MPGRYTPPKQEQKRLVALANGMAVEEDVYGIVERIRAYDPNLNIKYIDPALCDMFDAPYLITENCPDGIERVVTQVWSMDETVFQKIVQADTNRHKLIDQVLRDMEAKNEKVKAAEAAAQRDKNDSIQELVADVIGSPKDTYTADNPLTGERHKFTSIRQE